jgi:CHAD domain-containing protein
MLDAFEPLYGETGRAYTRALGKLQDVLGDLHDAAVRQEHFAGLVNVSPPLPSSAGFVMGRLAERDRLAYDRCQRKFSKTYSRIRGRRWRALAELMQSQSQPETL